MSAVPQIPALPAPSHSVKVDPPPSQSRWVWWVGAAVLTALLAYWALRPSPEKQVVGPVVRYAKIAPGPLISTLRLSGTTHATEFMNIITPRQQAPEASNRMLLQELIPSGTIVKKGQVIAVIDATALRDHIDDLGETVRQAKADIGKRKAEQQIEWQTYLATVRSAKSDMEKAKLDQQAAEVKTAIDKQLLELAVKQTTARYDQLVADMKIRQAENASEIRILELTTERHERHRNRHMRDMAEFTVRAPMDGMAVVQTVWYSGEMREIRQGDQVYPGLLLIRVVNPAKMQVEGRVNQAESQLIHAGQPVLVHLDAFPDMGLKGHVARIGALATGGWRSQDYIRTIPVIVQLDQMDKRVIPDLTAAADIELQRADHALKVPLAALHWDKKQAFVYLRNGKRKDITLGFKTNVEAQVLDGLHDGDEVRLN